MSHILIGNALSLVATIFLFSAVSKKDNYTLIKLQGISHLFFCMAGIVIQGYSGAVQDGVGAVRNFIIYSNKNTNGLKILLLSVSILAGIYFNNICWIGLFPVIGTVQYTLVSTVKGIQNKHMQISIILNSILMSIYSLSILNYVNVCTNIGVICISINTLRTNLK